MSFPLWRQHLRLVSSLNLLETNLSVQEIAFKVGYNADSSFIFPLKNYSNKHHNNIVTVALSLALE